MSKRLKVIFYTCVLLFFGLFFLIFRPVPIVEEERAIVEKGVVTQLYGTAGNDIVLVLKNTKRRFYINRGLENGLKIDTLTKKLMGKEITLKYPKYWTPLDWNHEVKHISKLAFENEVLFNELK